MDVNIARKKLVVMIKVMIAFNLYRGNNMRQEIELLN